MPDYMGTITTLVQTPDAKMSEILINGVYMLLFAIGSMAAVMISGYFAAKHRRISRFLIFIHYNSSFSSCEDAISRYTSQLPNNALCLP